MNYIILIILTLFSLSLSQEIYMLKEECNDPICLFECNSKRDIMISLSANFDADEFMMIKYQGVVFSTGAQESFTVSFNCFPEDVHEKEIIETNITKLENPKRNKEGIYLYVIFVILIYAIFAKSFNEKDAQLSIFASICMIILILILPLMLIGYYFMPDMEEYLNEEVAPSSERN